jgi:hypothetical protein
MIAVHNGRRRDRSVRDPGDVPLNQLVLVVGGAGYDLTSTLVAQPERVGAGTHEMAARRRGEMDVRRPDSQSAAITSLRHRFHAAARPGIDRHAIRRARAVYKRVCRRLGAELGDRVPMVIVVEVTLARGDVRMHLIRQAAIGAEMAQYSGCPWLSQGNPTRGPLWW